MRNYTGKKYRGSSRLSSTDSKLFIDADQAKALLPKRRKAQCRACKHKFNVTDIDHKDCPKCGCEQTSIIQ